MILKCPFCKADVAPSQQTCPACSKRMTRRCPACAEDIAIVSKNCKYCGEDIAAPSAARTPDIQFIEEAPKKKRKCCGKFLMALVLFAGLGTAAVAVRTDCVACAKNPNHEACISTSHSISHCNRKICKDGKTPLWATVWEKMGGKACSKMRKDDWY
jgi:hypothetical protein